MMKPVKIRNNVEVSFTTHLTLTEGQLRALSAMAVYGFDSFISVFKEHLGEHYMRGLESELESLFRAIRDQAGPQLRTLDEARCMLEDAK